MLFCIRIFELFIESIHFEFINSIEITLSFNIILSICLDNDAWADAVKLYHQLNGGRLYGKIKIIKLTDNKDVADLCGDISDFYVDMR